MKSTNDLANVISEALEETIESMVEEAIEQEVETFDFESHIEKAVEAHDFSEVIGKACDDFNFSPYAEEAVEEAIRNARIENQVEEAVNNADFEAPARDAVLAFAESQELSALLKEHARQTVESLNVKRQVELFILAKLRDDEFARNVAVILRSLQPQPLSARVRNALANGWKSVRDFYGTHKPW